MLWIVFLWKTGSLKYLSITRAEEGTCTHSVSMVFLEVMPSEDLKWENSAKSNFPYNSSVGHLHMKDFHSVKNEIIRKWVLWYGYFSTFLSTLCGPEKNCKGTISWLFLSLTKTNDLTDMNNFYIKSERVPPTTIG